MKVGIISIINENNTFLPEPTNLEDYAIYVGEEVRRQFASAHNEVTGFFQGLAAAGYEAVPLLYASAGATGVVTNAALDSVWQLALDKIRELGPFDAILAAPHGAAVAEGDRHDMDGWWLTELRRIVGPKVPIVATIDPHCNLSQNMVDACDSLTAYRENPHIDQRQRGLEAAGILVKMLQHKAKPTMRAAFPRVMINIESQGTRQEPMLSVMRELDRVRAQPGVLSASIAMGYPYSDVPEMGTSFMVVTDNDPALAQKLVTELSDWLIQHRSLYKGDFISPEAAVQKSLTAKKPVGLLDMGDNMGGGAPSDSTVLVHLYQQLKGQKVFVCLADAESQAAARQAGVGAKLRLKMGGKSPVSPAAPLEADVVVIGLFEGKYRESEPRHGGAVNFDMGATAVVTTGTGLTIMLTARRAFPGSLGQMTSCGLQPQDFDVIILKGVHSPIAAYAPVCGTLIRVNTPGTTTADMVKSLVYHHRRKPLYPFEEKI